MAVLRQDDNEEIYAELGRVTELFIPGLRKMSSAGTKQSRSAAKVTASMRRTASVDIEREKGYVFRMGSYEAAEEDRGGVPKDLEQHLKAAPRHAREGRQPSSKRARKSSYAISAAHRLGDLFRWVGNVSTSIEDLADTNLLASGLVLKEVGDKEGAFFLLDAGSKTEVNRELEEVAK